MNMVFMCFSLVPLSVAIYFITQLNKYLADEALWLPECDQEMQDSIINRLEWNKSYYYILAGVTVLRTPQWFLHKIEVFRKIAIWMWFTHAFLGFFNLASVWLVSNVINSSVCSDAVLTNSEVFGWDSLK